MEVKYNEATINRPEGDRPIDSPVVLIDLPSFIEQIKSEKAWEENDRNSITVFKSNKMRIIVGAMHKNAEMQTEHPDNILSVQVIKGKLKLHTNEQIIDVEKGQIVALHEHIPYKIEAIKKTTFLLTLVE
jgi:quercetin dioxygenase-like cupin family protein